MNWFIFGTVVAKKGSRLKVHYEFEGCSRKWDVWSDYNEELNRFAKSGSISRRPAHRFKDLKVGDFVDINPTLKHIGWKEGEIHNFDKSFGPDTSGL